MLLYRMRQVIGEFPLPAQFAPVQPPGEKITDTNCGSARDCGDQTIIQPGVFAVTVDVVS